MDLTRDELAILASVHYYPIYEHTVFIRPSKRHSVIKSLVEHGLVFEMFEKGDPGELQTWVVRATKKGVQFFEGLSIFDRAIASRDAGLFDTMGKLIRLLPVGKLPLFLSSKSRFVQDCALKRLAELAGSVYQRRNNNEKAEIVS